MGLKKFKDWEGDNLDVYKIKDASDVGVGLTRHEWQGERTATQVGTTITANIMNELQKGLVHSIETIKKTEPGKEIYEINLNGISEFGLFKGLKLLLELKSGNQTNNVFIRIENTEYQIKKNQNEILENLEIDDLKTNKKYFVEFNGTQFVIINILNYATEQKNGIAKIYSEAESESTAEKVKEVVKTGNGDTEEVVNERPTGETVWSKLIKTLDHTKILSVRGLVKILSKFLKPATENEYGLVNFQTIKQVSPKPDLTPYIPFSKGYKNNNNADWIIRANNVDLWTPQNLYMFNEAGNYMGAYHLNGGRAYYKVPGRNGDGWNEIMDNHDMAVRDNRMNDMDADRRNLWGRAHDAWNKANDAQLNRIQNVRLAGYIAVIVWRQNEGYERNGYVVTGVLNDNRDTEIDRIQMRALQFYREGQWLNTPFT